MITKEGIIEYIESEGFEKSPVDNFTWFKNKCGFIQVYNAYFQCYNSYYPYKYCNIVNNVLTYDVQLNLNNLV